MHTQVKDGYGLSEAVYACGYRLRLKYSSFQRATMDWLLDNSGTLIPPDAPSILSLGCGDGAFDLELLDHLRGNKIQLEFCGVDFNGAELEEFRRILASRDEWYRERITLRCMKYDASTRFGRRYDFIYMVHFLHFFEQVMPAIRNALQHLAPQGRLLIIHQKSSGVYAVKQRFLGVLSNQKRHSSEEIKSLLEAEGIAFSAYTIDSYFDVSAMRQRSLEALLLMSFCFGDDLARLDKKVQDDMREGFLAHAAVTEDGKPLIYEPMDAIVCQA